MQERRYFIIRQTGKRDLHTGEKRCSLQSLSGKMDLSYRMCVEKERHGKKKVDTYFCGAKRVYFPNVHTHSYWDIPLWLVKAQRKGKNSVWYLCYLPVEDEQSAIEMVMEGYGLRRKIEEYHRQIKDDYHLEQICLRRYTALKNFMSIFMITMGFIYYKMAKAIAWFFSKTKLQNQVTFPAKTLDNQLKLGGFLKMAGTLYKSCA